MLEDGSNVIHYTGVEGMDVSQELYSILNKQKNRGSLQ